jgi:peptidylprolyl isomerase domain and WD repeat-containing protein 1
MVFDDSGYFLMFGSLKGIKIVNVFTNKVTKVVGMGESGERFLCVALYQGVPKVDNQFLLSKAGSDSSKPIDHSAEVLPDPTLYCSAFKKRRFYCFSRREPDESAEGAEGRDKFNEIPTVEERDGSVTVVSKQVSFQLATLHTTVGDICIKLFPEECPRTVENFTTHIRNGYYNNIIFHRVIKGS